MKKPKYLRKKVAKGRDYYYFDAGKGDNGQRVLVPLPHVRDPKFGGSYAAALGNRTKLTNKPGVMTLDGLIRVYEKSPEFRSRKEATKVSYTRYLAKANALMRSPRGESPAVKDIERRDVLKLRDTLAETPGAANQAIRALGAMFAWAVDNERAKDNPVKRIKKYAATPHEKWPEELLEEALTDPQIGDAVALFFFTGQRIDDVVAMRWNDIRGDHMLVWQKKKDKQIKVAILPELADRLNRIERPAVTILTNANGQPWTQSGLRQKLQDWAKARGHKVVPHGLRKNAVDALLEAGCTAAEVGGITDQSLQMVEHYSKGSNRLTLGRAAVVKLDAARKARNKA
jgi:integrase